MGQDPQSAKEGKNIPERDNVEASKGMSAFKVKSMSSGT